MGSAAYVMTSRASVRARDRRCGDPGHTERMRQPTASEHARVLGEVIEVCSVLIDPNVRPTATSPAAAELQGARLEPRSSGTWGEQPVEMAYEIARLNHRAALELSRAMVSSMTGEHARVPASVLARSMAEVSSQAWWLLEPGLGHVRRVRRAQALRYRSACEGARAGEEDGAPLGERYAETKAAVEQYSRDLNLDVPRQEGHVYVCGKERLPSASARVVAMFAEVDVPSVYSLLSGFPHGELHAG